MNLRIFGSARLRHFKKDTFPSMGSMQLDCGQCGNRHFEVYVEPKEDDARVVGLVCQECRNVWRIDMAAFLDGKGRARQIGIDELAEV